MKYARLAKVTALALAAVFFVPTSISLIRGADEKPQPNTASYVRIYIPGADAQSLATYGVQIVETYDGFILAKAETAQVDEMRGNGLAVEDASDLFTVNLRTAVFDVRDGEPATPDSLRINAYPAKVKGYYLVHFIGPVKE